MVHLISRVDPLKYIMSRPYIQGSIAKWNVLLSKFDIHYIPQQAVKGQLQTSLLYIQYQMIHPYKLTSQMKMSCKSL